MLPLHFLALSTLLANGGFEEGLRGWRSVCLESCLLIQPSPSARSGSSALLLTSEPGTWASSELSQEGSLPPGGGTLRLQLFTRPAQASSLLSAALLTLQLSFLAHNVTHASSCTREWAVLSAEEYTGHELSCTVPPAATAVTALFRLASVRSETSLLVDDVSLSLLPPRGDGGGESGLARSEKEEAPRRLHLIFGLTHDFGGKPFGLVHHVVIKAAHHFYK